MEIVHIPAFMPFCCPFDSTFTSCQGPQRVSAPEFAQVRQLFLPVGAGCFIVEIRDPECGHWRMRMAKDVARKVPIQS